MGIYWSNFSSEV